MEREDQMQAVLKAGDPAQNISSERIDVLRQKIMDATNTPAPSRPSFIKGKVYGFSAVRIRENVLRHFFWEAYPRLAVYAASIVLIVGFMVGHSTNLMFDSGDTLQSYSLNYHYMPIKSAWEI